MPRFLRNASLEILSGHRKGRSFAIYRESTEITGLRISFRIEKNLDLASNTATVRIFNMSKATIRLFEKKPVHIILRAGYSTPEIIFRGDLLRVTHSESGPDKITEVFSATGKYLSSDGRISASYRAGTSLKRIIADITKSVGKQVSGDIFGKLESGITLDGPAMEQVSKLMRSRGHSVTNHDGTIQILKRDKAGTVPAILVSEETGLISTPKVVPAEHHEGPHRVSGKFRLTSKLVPGNLIDLQSADIKGIYKLDKVQIHGDTHATPWYCIFEGVKFQ